MYSVAYNSYTVDQGLRSIPCTHCASTMRYGFKYKLVLGKGLCV